MFLFLWGLMKSAVAHPTKCAFAPSQTPEETRLMVNPLYYGDEVIAMSTLVRTGHVFIRRVTEIEPDV